MYSLFLKRIIRNKWVLVKIFIFSPILNILPILLTSENFMSVTFEKILNLCIWTYMYFVVFECLNMNISCISNGKIYDIVSSRVGIYRNSHYQKLALMSAFLLSYLYSLFGYSLIFHLKIDYLLLLITTTCMFIFTFVICDLTLFLELRFKSYFNKFNFVMNILFITSGVLYTLEVVPNFIRVLSYINPLTFVFDYVYSKSIMSIYIFLLLTILLQVVLRLLVISALYRTKRYDIK